MKKIVFRCTVRCVVNVRRAMNAKHLDARLVYQRSCLYEFGRVQWRLVRLVSCDVVITGNDEELVILINLITQHAGIQGLGT